MFLKHGVIAAILGITYHALRTALAIFLPDFHQTLLQSPFLPGFILHCLYIVSSLAFSYFFICFYRSIPGEGLLKLRKATLTAFIGVIIPVISALGVYILNAFKVDYHHSVIVWLILAAVAAFSLVTLFVFFLAFHNIYTRSGTPLRKASVLAIIGVCMLFVIVFLSFLDQHFFTESSFAMNFYIKETGQLFSLFACFSLIYFFVVFLKETK